MSMLSYRPSAYAANGMSVGDAKLLLGAEGLAGLDLKTLAVRPRAGASMTWLGAVRTRLAREPPQGFAPKDPGGQGP